MEKPAGLLVGFGSEDDWFEYKLENDPRFLQRIAQARTSLQAGKGIRLEDLSARSAAPKAASGESNHVARLLVVISVN